MNNKTIALLLLVLIVIASFGPIVSAAPEADGSKQFRYSFANADTSFSGTRSSKLRTFQLPDYWNVQDVTLNMDYAVTQLLKQWITSVTVFVNDTPFYSFRPELKEGRIQHLSIAVPKELLRKGDNKLELQSYIRTLDDELCSVDQIPDQWLQLSAATAINVRYTSQPLDGTIADFYERFSGLDSVFSGESAIVTPDQSEPEELEAAVYALSGFARSNPFEDKQIPLVPYKEDRLKDKELVVLIGLYDRLPDEIKTLLGDKDVSGKAWLQLLDIGGKTVLVATSRNRELLTKAGRLIANTELMGQLQTGAKAVEPGADVAMPKPAFRTHMALTATGDELKGAGYTEKTYFVPLPVNRTVVNDGEIRLHFRYAQNLDFNRALVTVYVNQTPIGSKHLTRELADGDTAVFTIPSDLTVSGNFSVTVGFDLRQVEAACLAPQSNSPWAYTTNESMIDFRTKDRTELLFGYYPSPFIRDGIYNRVGVVLPQKRDDYTYETFSNLFNLLGKNVGGNTGDVTVYGDDVRADDLQDRNIIAIGTYEDNAVIRTSNDKLYFQYDGTGGSFLSNEKMSIDPEYGSRVGTLQLLDSPYAAGNAMLVVTGARSESYYLASKLLANEKGKWSLYGDGVLTDKDGILRAFRFKKEAGDRSGSFLPELLVRRDVLRFSVAGGTTMIVVLVSLLLLTRKHRKKRKKRGGRR
ncbi:cellulose biosynthesis cyclic di-GMP-binding regulatory protein BcsB [Paenibacillus ginsengarvi]|nr:cellulose biosynthesis cyclic di-GMP-binding regulatory protein BcsB [Paenibacillus ginsengarvi]